MGTSPSCIPTRAILSVITFADEYVILVAVIIFASHFSNFVTLEYSQDVWGSFSSQISKGSNSKILEGAPKKNFGTNFFCFCEITETISRFIVEISQKLIMYTREMVEKVLRILILV